MRDPFLQQQKDSHRGTQDRFELHNLIEIVDGVQSRRCRHELFLRLNTVSSAGFLHIASGFNLNEIITWKNRPAYPTTVGGKKKIRQPKSAEFQQYGQNIISIVKVFHIPSGISLSVPRLSRIPLPFQTGNQL